MPYGMLSCCLGVFLGGLLGSLLKNRIRDSIRQTVPMIVGLTAICSGFVSVVKATYLPAVTLAVIVGGWLGHACRLEERLQNVLWRALHRIPRPEDFDMARYITIVAVFCASGFGLYSVMVESISGDRAQIISKAILDFFIALIYGGSMGIAISLVALPQLAVFTCFFFLAKILIPMMSDAMLTNFIACGGVLSIAAGMRMAKIRQYPVIDMLPALALILVLTPLWERLFP